MMPKGCDMKAKWLSKLMSFLIFSETPVFGENFVLIEVIISLISIITPTVDFIKNKKN